jgi:putative ABC transport system permease protein
MSPIQISWKNLMASPLSFLLNCLLIAFGTGILTLLLISSAQFKDKLQNNAKDIDLVVGAKGSPLQLILSSIYHIDFPTGNISLTEANLLAHNPLVKRAVPICLGDNYEGFRIVGTDTSFVHLYGLTLASGKFWANDFEVTIGTAVAQSLKLRVGDRFFGSHGLSSSQDEHKDHPYKVAGILNPQENVTDQMIITNMASIWTMHDPKTEVHPDPEKQQSGAELQHTEEDQHTDEHHHQEKAERQLKEKEITALLIQYYSPMSVILFPRMVNKTTNMQAASPALESARLFAIIGIGIDTLQWFAICMMFIAAVSVFVSIYNSLKERKYDLAVMRIMGASKGKLFLIIIIEGMILTTIGALSGFTLGHLSLELIGSQQASTQARLSGFYFLPQEGYLFLAGVALGIVAALIPAIQAYRADIARTISKK